MRDKLHPEILTGSSEQGFKQRWGKRYFLALCVNISKMVEYDTIMLQLMTNRKLHMGFDWHLGL